MNCIIWNCQGVASREVLRTIKELVRLHNPFILALLEPKVSGIKADEICNNLKFDDWVRVEALGFSGGIWILWKDRIKLDILRTNPQFIFMQVQDHKGERWLFTVVYGSPSHSLRKNLWKNLRQEEININGPWLVAGDFNAVTSPSEISDPTKFSQYRSIDFTDWIFEQGLVDMGFEGQNFTWRRDMQNNHLRAARLDRALGNMEWRMKFQSCKVRHLPMIQSDHAPLLINVYGVSRGKTDQTFKFQAAWLLHKDFEDLVRKSWRPHEDCMSNSRNLLPKLTK